MFERGNTKGPDGVWSEIVDQDAGDALTHGSVSGRFRAPVIGLTSPDNGEDLAQACWQIGPPEL